MNRRTMLAVMLLSAMLGCGGGATEQTPDAPDAEAIQTDDDMGTADDDDVSRADVEADLGEDAAPHSMHHRLGLLSGGYVGATVEVRIDEVPRHGLRFFALQVNFARVAWAHGGLQADPENGRANWGGLVSGIDYDYEGAEQQVLAAVQNMPGRSSDVSWEEDTWYRYEVRRGELEELPPGEYSVLDEEPVMVDEARQMWRWTFTITNVDTGELVWEQYLYVAHDLITSATYWTETGYGIECSDKLTVQWRNPYFERENGSLALPYSMNKSMAQSTCPDESTTDMETADNGGEWGTVQRYGVPRPADSEDGDLLYYRSIP